MAPPRPLSFLLSLLLIHPSSSSSLPPQLSPPLLPQEPPQHRTALLLAPILSNLGFQELAFSVPALLYSPLLSSWPGPITLFAPSDDSIRSCLSCSSPRLLREHLVPGLFSSLHLSKLASGTKLESASPGRCLTITSFNSSSESESESAPKIFVDGVEITRPDLFNDGQIIIHGLHGFVAPLSPASCAQESFPSPPITRLMLRDAILRLREGGFGVLALAMRVKYAELAGLNNMTVFALDDPSIFAGGHAYLSNVRFHVVPNRMLMRSDLRRLRRGAVLPTLVRGQHLVVTQAGGGGPLAGGVRINYVPIKEADVVCNAKIVVHSIFLPFPHLYLADLAAEGILDQGSSKIRPAAFDGGIGICGDADAVEAGKCPLGWADAPTSWADVDLDEGV